MSGGLDGADSLIERYVRNVAGDFPAQRGRLAALNGSRLGRELRYALLSSDDLLYRLTVSDRLIRDVLDYPHRIVLDKLGTNLS